jgi:hypothetical protein
MDTPAPGNPTLDALTLVRLAQERPAHELFRHMADNLAFHHPGLRVKNFTVAKTPVLTISLTLPDEAPLGDYRNHLRG